MYTCTLCRKIFPNLDKIFFVEENCSKGFCSDLCIEKFYSTFIEYFENEELLIRKNMKLSDEKDASQCDNQQYIDLTINYPDKIQVLKNTLGECFYQLHRKINIKKNESLYFIIYCFIYDGVPSFVFNSVATSSKELIKQLSFPEKCNLSVLKSSMVEVADHKVNFDLEIIEQKKSAMLAVLINNIKENDIAIEDFPLYDHFIEETLKKPDEILHHVDDDSDHIFTFIKSLISDDEPLFYFVICYGQEQDISSNNLTTIITFPTKMANLHSLFKTGKVISGTLLN